MKTEEMISSVIKEINNRSGFVNQWDFELTLRRILTTKFDEARKAGIEAMREACAKVCDDEVMRLDRLSMEYKQRGDMETATRFSACIVTAAKLGREIRARAESEKKGE